jgi:hypothetical protein
MRTINKHFINGDFVESHGTAVAENATTSNSISQGIVVYEGLPLNAPTGLTFNPLNGDLITVNQLDNNMVDVARSLGMDPQLHVNTALVTGFTRASAWEQPQLFASRARLQIAAQIVQKRTS